MTITQERVLHQIEAVVFRRRSVIEYLVLKRCAERGGFWQPITGGVEFGESTLQAVAREVREEAGVDKIVDIIDLHYCFTFRKGLLCFHEDVFGVEISSEKEIQISHEHVAYEWVDFREALLRYKWQDNRRALKKLNDMLRSLPTGHATRQSKLGRMR